MSRLTDQSVTCETRTTWVKTAFHTWAWTPATVIQYHIPYMSLNSCHSHSTPHSIHELQLLPQSFQTTFHTWAWTPATVSQYHLSSQHQKHTHNSLLHVHSAMHSNETLTRQASSSNHCSYSGPYQKLCEKLSQQCLSKQKLLQRSYLSEVTHV